MRKLVVFLLSFMLLFSFREGKAQTERGNLIIGTQLADITGSFQEHGSSFNFEVSPAAAYFIKDNLALGAMVDLGVSSGKNTSTVFTYGIGPWARYYFAAPEQVRMSPHAAFFVDGFAGFQGISQKHGGSTNGMGIKVGPGLSYFLTSNIALEAALQYNLVVGFGNAITQNRLGLNIGFQIFLPGHEMKEKYNDGSF